MGWTDKEDSLMEIDGLFSAIFIGAFVGMLGRLVVPGRQRMGLLLTLLVGIVAALLGTAAASVLGLAETRGIDWIEIALQVGLAAGGVALLSGIQSRTSARR
jgi:uncharacterized membrane protein YeaQ/YmgE (transglycosylase-associated protein family)